MARRGVKLAGLAGLAALAALAVARADTISLPAPALDRDGSVVALWRPDPPEAGTLLLDWTDAAGRLVERHALTLDAAEREVAVPLDLRRARAMRNRLEARFQPRDGGAARLARAGFVARPPAGWPGYQVILWQDQTAEALAALPALGITGTKLLGPLTGQGQLQADQRLDAGLRWYDENLATDFYSAYHRWHGAGVAVTDAFDRVRARQRAAPGDLSVYQRQPSLSDPAWLNTVGVRLAEVARRQAPFRPLFLNLADEAGIADLAAAWDFDLSDAALRDMRAWLRGRTPTLDALNAAWGTHFPAWDAVRPALTDDAVRDDAAVPSWMAFHAWMDEAFARAVRAGTDAVHRGDADALAGLEGAQSPGWGGYDYGRLAGAADVMEIYDLGNAVEIARSLNPALRVLTTSATDDDQEAGRLWHELLLGSRGTILWDEAGGIVGPDGRPGARGGRLGPLLRAFTGALGAQVLDAPPAPAAVAILYSQPSFRLTWLLERRRESTPWQRRDAAAENADDPWRAATRRAAALLAALGVPARWITPETLEGGGLARDGVRLLVLPHSLALSDASLDAVRRFIAAGGTVLADTAPGPRDDLGRPRPDATRDALRNAVLMPDWLRTEGAPPDGMAAALDAAGVRRALTVREADGRLAAGLDVRLLQSGSAVIAAIQRRDAGPGVRILHLDLPAPAWITPLGGPRPAGPVAHLLLPLDRARPALLAIAPAPLPGPTLPAPAGVEAGALVDVRLGLGGASPLAAHWMQVQVLDPDGREVPALTQSVRVTGAGGHFAWPVAVNDRPGQWTLRATDAASGGLASAAVQVRPPPS